MHLQSSRYGCTDGNIIGHHSEVFTRCLLCALGLYCAWDLLPYHLVAFHSILVRHNVIKPLQYKLKFSVRRMRILIFCCWLSGFLIETPIIPRISGFESKNGSSPGCEWTFEINKVKSWTLAIALFAGQTFVPCCLISAAYLHILLRFRAKASASPCYDVRKKMLKRATLMMAVASLVLILCWMPNQIYFLLGQLGYIDFKQSVPSTIVVALAFFNCWMNPIIYGFMNVEFRRGYRQLLVLCLRTSWVVDFNQLGYGDLYWLYSQLSASNL